MKNMLDFFTRQTKARIPERYRNEFSQELLRLNIKHDKMLSYFLIVVNLCLLIIDLSFTDFWTESRHVFLGFSVYHISFFVTAIVFLTCVYIGEKLNNTSLSFYKVAHLFLIGTVLTISALIATYPGAVYKQLFTYVIAMFSISSLIYLSRYEIIAIYTLPLFVFGISAFETYSDPIDFFGDFFFLIIFAVISSVIATINYRSIVRGFIDTKTILEKNNELKELSSLLKATFDNIPDGIMVFDMNHNLKHYNKAASDYFTVKTENMDGQKCHSIFGEKEECKDCILSEVERTKQPAQIERQSESLDSWLDIRAYPIFNDSGYLVEVIEHVRDITPIKQYEEELQRTNSILRTQLEASPDGIIVIDYKWRVLSFNNKFLDVWNIPHHTVRKDKDGVMLKNVLANVTDEKDFMERMKALDTLPFESSCDLIKLKDGRILETHSVPILLFEGETFGRVWYFRDITDKVRMDEALRKSAEENMRLLNESMKYDDLKSEFFSNISHELRTPINVLLGTLQLMNLQNTMSEDKPKNLKLERHIGIMKQNCYRLLRMTNNLIDMTRLDTGFLEINLQNYNIVEVVEDITVSVAEYIENKGISLTFDTDVEEKNMAIDADKIERILLNLLSNAVKFTRNHGAIWVNVHDKGDSVEVSVKDTGIGIPEDKLGIIFERFRQVNSSLTRASEGSGIGLSLVKNLVELHGGKIKVKSEINIGSEFILEFPCVTAAYEEEKRPIVHSMQSHVERINIEFSDIYS